MSNSARRTPIGSASLPTSGEGPAPGRAFEVSGMVRIVCRSRRSLLNAAGRAAVDARNYLAQTGIP